MSIFAEIYTDYVDDNSVRHIDGYHTPADYDSEEEEEGVVIAYVFNRQVYYTNPEYQYDEYVKDTIKLLKEEGEID